MQCRWTNISEDTSGISSAVRVAATSKTGYTTQRGGHEGSTLSRADGASLYTSPNWNIGTVFPALTTLILPFMISYMPFPDYEIISLRTLVLDGSLTCDAWTFQTSLLLYKTPNLETVWCKDQRMYRYDDVSNLNSLSPRCLGTPSVTFPIALRALTKLALALPGSGYDLLLAIEAPALKDRHINGTRDDESYDYALEAASLLPRWDLPVARLLDATQPRTTSLFRSLIRSLFTE
ncbi:hypothetical protein BDN70DRAFT_681679 [Pholiota conissans]|uniref:Uncharacterized protein n=1 Tax=Pholiota conissans TaxID=109636 RepID=A0A9P5ZDN5_9AGAR|nr:hypothetical protein BDN70DRAFT_681679 [Pholiota conissans]